MNRAQQITTGWAVMYHSDPDMWRSDSFHGVHVEGNFDSRPWLMGVSAAVFPTRKAARDFLRSISHRRASRFKTSIIRVANITVAIIPEEYHAIFQRRVAADVVFSVKKRMGG